MSPARHPAAGTVCRVPPPLWDVIIIGAGPAGSAAAASALDVRPGARVLLLDKKTFPRDKACGDGIAAEALDVLGSLGFDVDAVLRGFPPIDRLRLRSPGGSVVERRMARPVWTIPRTVLDARLVADVVARGAVLQQRQVRSVEPGADDVVVDGVLRARVVVGADGAESVVRRMPGIFSVGADAGFGRAALAIRGYSSALPGQGRAQWITMSGQNWPAYAWSFPIGDGSANVGYGELIDNRSLSRAAMLRRMSELLPGLEPATGLRAHRLPLSPGRPRVADGRVLLAGDALSLINPLSGEGIFYALRSGALAGRAAAAGAGAGLEYRTQLGRALGRHLRSSDVAARLVRAQRLIDGGVRAAGRHQPVFDDLVSLALGDGRLTPRLLSGVVLQAFLPGGDTR